MITFGYEVGKNTIKVWVKKTADAEVDTYYYYCHLEGDNDLGVQDGAYHLFEGLTPNTKYYINVRVKYTNGDTELGETVAVTTQSDVSWTHVTDEDDPIGEVLSDPNMNISVEAYHIYRYTVTFNRAGTAKFNVRANNIFLPHIYLTTSRGFNSKTGEPTGDILAEAESTLQPSFDYDVATGTTYYFWVKGDAAEELGSEITGEATLHIEPPANALRPKDFSWSDSFASGKPAVTINKQGSNETVSFNHWEEWNAFVERVEDFLKYTEWIDEYGDYISGAKLEEGDNLSASKFDKVRVCIEAMNSFDQTKYRSNAIYLHYKNEGRWYMKSDEKMKAEYFTALAEVLNDIE